MSLVERIEIPGQDGDGVAVLIPVHQFSEVAVDGGHLGQAGSLLVPAPSQVRGNDYEGLSGWSLNNRVVGEVSLAARGAKVDRACGNDPQRGQHGVAGQSTVLPPMLRPGGHHGKARLGGDCLQLQGCAVSLEADLLEAQHRQQERPQFIAHQSCAPFCFLRAWLMFRVVTRSRCWAVIAVVMAPSYFRAWFLASRAALRCATSF